MKPEMRSQMMTARASTAPRRASGFVGRAGKIDKNAPFRGMYSLGRNGEGGAR